MISSRGDYEAQAAFAWYVQAMQEQSKIMSTTMSQSFEEARKSHDQEAMIGHAYVGQYVATAAKALTNEFPKYFTMIGLVRTDIVGTR